MAALADAGAPNSDILTFPGAPFNGGPLSPCAQVRQFGSAIGSLLLSVCERTDTAFRRTCVTKTNRAVDPPLPYKMSYIEDINTGDLYNTEKNEAKADLSINEDLCTVATKCFLIVLGAPFYTVGKILSNAIRTPIEIGAIAFKTLYQVGSLLSQGECLNSCTAIASGLYQIGETCGERLFEIIKAPIFGLGVELAALYGIFKPYHGRKFVAMIENAWQNGASYKNDVRNIPKCSNNSPCEMFNRPFYLAYCFQVRGNTNNPHYSTVVSRESFSRW